MTKLNNKTNKNTQSKQQYENTIAKNLGCAYSDFLKLANKKDFIEFIKNAKEKTHLKGDTIENTIVIDSNILVFLNKYICVDYSQISNNQLKKYISMAYYASYENGLQSVDKTKDEIVYKNGKYIKASKFFKQLNLNLYFDNKKVVKNRLTGNFETINLK